MKALAISAAVLLAACGGGGSGSVCESPEATLQAVNAARAAGAWCGPAAGPLTIDQALQGIAQAFANDLASNGIKAGHIGSDGSTFGDRLTRGGYRWAWAGENTAFGTSGAAATVEAFKASKDHCPNLMAQQAVDAGLACASDGQDAYWVQLMGRK